jgi:hypothetical protein
MIVVRYTGACLDHNNIIILATCRLWTIMLLGLALLRYTMQLWAIILLTLARGITADSRMMQ